MNIIDPDSIFLLAAILFPLVIGLVLVFLPAFVRRDTVDTLAIFGFTIPLICVIYLASIFNPIDVSGYDFMMSVPLGLEAIGIKFSLGLNAFSVPMMVLTVLVGLAVAFYTVGSKVDRRALFWGLLLLIFAGTLGAFASTDIFYSFLFHEIALLPTLLAIAVFGGANRRSVTIEVGLWLLAGSLLILAGMLFFYFKGGAESFQVLDIRERLTDVFLSASFHPIIWGFLLSGLAIIVGLFPFYNWVPKLLSTAPTAVSMLHVGALKMFGIYYLVQFFVGWTHLGVIDVAILGSVLAVGAILFLGIATLHQTDLNRLLSYATVSHVGSLVLGLLAYTHDSVIGLSLMMVGSGLAMALLFMAAGMINRRVGSLEMLHLGGLRKMAPRLATVIMIGFMAVAALPCFVTFVGEFGVMLGVMRTLPWAFLAMAAGLMITATYSIRAINSLLMGSPKPSTMRDMGVLEFAAASVLILPLILLAFIPSLITGPLSSFISTLMPFTL